MYELKKELIEINMNDESKKKRNQDKELQDLKIEREFNKSLCQKYNKDCKSRSNMYKNLKKNN